MRCCVALAISLLLAVACGTENGDDDTIAPTPDLITQDAEVVGESCGDGACSHQDGSETCETCPDDCGTCPAICGDQVCNTEDGTEDCDSCPGDCGECPDLCGNGTCDDGETNATCPDDCPDNQPECGDGVCQTSEDSVSCPDDCQEPPLSCGDGFLDPDEICDDGNTLAGDGCSADCLSDESCGNDICDTTAGEDADTCDTDCGQPDPCGDGNCTDDENFDNCPEDCPPPDPCGNFDCEEGENWQNCPTDCDNPCGDALCDADETCDVCPQDCGGCEGAPFCSLSGDGDAEFSCPLKLAANSESSPKATGIQFKFNFDPDLVTFLHFHVETCPTPDCAYDIPPEDTVEPTDHSVEFIELAPGVIKVLMFNFKNPEAAITEAWINNCEIEQDAQIMDLVFVLDETIAAEDAVAVTLDDMVATDAEANELVMELQDGILVTSEK